MEEGRVSFMQKLRLDGRVAVITGGGRGIGLACAEALAEAGAAVVLADIDAATAEDGKSKLAVLGYDADTIAMDVADPAAVEAAAASILARHGKVDILVANAGIGRPSTAAEDIADEDWIAVNDVNSSGVFWCCRAFGRGMLKQRSGAIVVVGSMSGTISNRPQGQAHYNASKAAAHHLTRTLGAEWADRGIRVNAVAPTYIETPLIAHAYSSGMATTWLDSTPMHRFGQAHEVASVVHFLASDAASLMTGAVVPVDGGYTAW